MSIRLGHRRFLVTPIERAAHQVEPDLLEGLTDPELREFLATESAIRKATRPRVSDATLGEASRSIRRWLRLAARTVGAEVDRYQQTSKSMWPIRKATFDVAPTIWDQLSTELKSVLDDLYQQVGEQGLAAAAIELGIAYIPGQVLAPAVLDRLALDVVRITDATRASIVDAVQTAIEQGYSTDQLVAGVVADGFTGLRDIVGGWANRADTIALTETANAYNLSSLAAYGDSGLVEEVDVYDGPGCGWTEHDDPDLADGSRRTLDEADQYPEAHPNCQRAFGPVVLGAPDEG